MKRILAVLFVTMLAGKVWAYDFQSGNLYYNITSDSTVEVTYQYQQSLDNYLGIDTATIPEKVNYNGVEYAVTSIGNYAFCDCDGLTSVSIPKTVTSIKSNAFCNCYGLTSVTIPNSVTMICENAFYVCSRLTSVTIPNSVTSIGNYAFGYCMGLVSIIIPNSVTEIEGFAFKGVKNIIYEGSAIGRPWGALNVNGIIDEDFIYADAEKTTLTAYLGNDSNVIIPNSVTIIKDSAFWGCSVVKSIEIPNSVECIENVLLGSNLEKAEFPSIEKLCNIKFKSPISYAYHLYINGEEVSQVIIPSSVISIGNYTFTGCSNLTSVTIPNSVTTIGNGAFSFCSSLEAVAIPNSVTTIGNGAFSSCSNLTSVTIPNSVSSIGNNFGGCPNLEFNEYDNAYYLGNTENPYVALIKAKTNITSCEINDSCKFILGGAFRGRKILSINIPHSVVQIGEEAFYSCKVLTSVTIHSPVKIGEQAFAGCIDLTNVSISEDSTREGIIGNSAFRFCSSLVSITIPEGFTEIGNQAFFNCSSLKTISIPNSITSIGFYAFERCDESIYTVAGPGMYLGNRENKYLVLITADTKKSNYCSVNDKCKVIADNAFWLCAGMFCVAIPESVLYINDAFFHENTIIFCRVAEKPLGWGPDWNNLGKVELGCKFLNVDNYTYVDVNEGSSFIPWCTNNAIVTINAVNRNGYHFVKWSDGNTDNPRTIIMSEDLTLTTVYEENENQSNPSNVAESAANAINILAHGNTIVVENATDEIRVYNAMGALICRDAIHRVRTEISVNGAGVYLVKTGGTVKRVMVN